MSEPLRPLIAGNWKMNGLRAALDQIEALDRKIEAAGPIEADIMIAPPATLIALAAPKAHGSVIALGGQDCHTASSGAHTGDISAQMLADSGASYVILGHSERRADHGETDALVRSKTLAALEAGLAPIVCVGETLTEREAGTANQVVSTQLDGSLPDGEGPTGLVVAYEPVWAIGTGKTPTLDDIAAMHAHIRETLVTRYGKTGLLVRILYGGSVKPGNAGEILALPDVDGALVGGASLLAEDFFAIVSAA